jgi:hypothetical protein
MRTYPFIHARQFLPSRPINAQAFTPHHPQAKLRLRFFAAGLSTAALLAFIYSESLSAKPNHRTTSLTPIEYGYSPNGSYNDRLVIFSPDDEYLE